MSWKTILANRIETADLSITACIVAIMFFVKFNQHEKANKANRVIAYCLGFGFLCLVFYRIYRGLN